jgi:histidinol-phosphatase (PHP family)
MPVGAICEKAIAKGLCGIAITDHVNADAGRAVCRGVIKNLKSDVTRARREYGDKLEISAGIELGEGHHDLALSREIASDGGLDFIIGSLHRLRGSADYYFFDYDGADMDELFAGYYEELMEMARAGCFDVVGHINYQVRYMTASARKRLTLPLYYDELRKILRAVAGAGRGIEINTSGLWRGLGFTLPSLDVVKMFREEGGEIVTTGSDAHQLGFVGEGMGGAVDCAKSAGFGRFAFYSKRTPRFYNV